LTDEAGLTLHRQRDRPFTIAAPTGLFNKDGLEGLFRQPWTGGQSRDIRDECGMLSHAPSSGASAHMLRHGRSWSGSLSCPRRSPIWDDMTCPLRQAQPRWWQIDGQERWRCAPRSWITWRSCASRASRKPHWRV